MILKILPWIFGLIGLGIMVFIHELGHFVAAKINGVAVEVFSLGWGPRMVGFTRGGTTYQISWFPVGGYCKMRGELVPGIAGGGAEAAAAGADVRPVSQESHSEGSFLGAAPWQRIIIAAFGPLFNLLFAIAVFTIIWWIGFGTPSAGNKVVLATDYTLDSFPKSPPATLAGLKTGDTIVAINGAPVEKFQDLLERVSVSPGQKLAFTVARQVNGSPQTVSLSITPELDKDTGAARIGIYPWVDPVVDAVAPGSAAAFAGLKKGDRIVGLDDRPVANSIDVSQDLVAKPQKVMLAYERAGATIKAPLVLEYDAKGTPNLGVSFAVRSYPSPRFGFAGAARKGLDETWSTAVLTVKGIGLLFQGIKIRNAVAGPLRIVYYIGTVATTGGAIPAFQMLSFLSVVLFLMNLLPIPATDGGQIILFLIEIGRGKPLRSKLIWRMQIIGFSILMTVLVLVLFADGLFFAGR